MQLPTSLAQTLTNITLPSYPSVTGLPQPITARSLAAFAGALIWAWLLLVSFVGWGRLTGKLFRVQRLPASVACSLGIAAIVFLGGWLNLLHAIYPSVLFGLTAIGLVVYLALRRQRPEEYRWSRAWQETSLSSRILLMLSLILLSLRIAATVRLGMFNNLDDNAAYLVFPHKMLAVHSFASDPFSDRRVISSLGGSYLLQAFVIAATSLTHIAMADRTLGLILLGGILFDIGVAFGLSLPQIIVLEFLASLVPIETINLTFIILPISLLLGAVWMLWETERTSAFDRWKYASFAGAIGGAAIAMKSTYLPIVVVFLAISFCIVPGIKPIKTALRIFVIAILGCLVVLLAWMIAMKQSSGTYLFPILGHGVDYSSYGIMRVSHAFRSYRTFFKIFLQGALLLAMAGLQFFLGNKGRQAQFSVGILIAAAIAITAFNYKSGGDFIWRYNFPQFFCAVIIFYLAGAGAIKGLSSPGHRDSLLFCLGVFALLAMIFYYDAAGTNPQPFRQVGMEWNDYRPSLRASVTGSHLANPQIKAEYAQAEHAIPLHAVALENIAYPFLFHFADHTILIADWPGAASPSQAWPFEGSGSLVALYLLRHSVRYVIYDYRYARWEDVEACKALESPLRNSEELTALWRITILVHHQFDQFRIQYHSTYDDGKIAVIDLDSPRQDAPAPPPYWTLNTSKEQMCSAVLARYLANPSPQSSE